MIRALYTAASGMSAQQQNIDNVAHNLANVNTTGFKKARVEFEDLVYDQTRVPGAPTSTTGEAPIGLETGLGVRAVATARLTHTEAGRPLQFVTLEDAEGLVEVSLFDGTCAQVPYLTMGPYVATGVVEDRFGACAVTARRFEAASG